MTTPLLAVFKKELTDTLRDRRTLVAMIVVPLLLFPVLLIGVAKFTQSQAREAEAKVVRVAVVDPMNDSGVAARLEQQPGLTIERSQDVSQLPQRIRDEALDAAVVVDPTFQQNLAKNRPGGVTLMFRSSEDFAVAKRRIQTGLDALEKDLLDQRFTAAGLEPSFVDAIAVQEHDITSPRERIGKIVGGLLPSIFIIFCFTGCMYPAIDLAAGEKERGTLETLLTAPVARRTLVLGKFLVVALAGVVSALIAMIGLYVSVSNGIEGLPPGALEAVAQLLDPVAIAAVLAILVPLSAFFAAGLLMLSVYARTYKEAMSLISPLMVVVLVPAMLALLPGTELTLVTALVPILNVSLATKELLADTAEPLHVVLVFVSLTALAAASLVACTRWFAREDIVFRS
jgi:sodium transport system permease protein